MTETTRSCASTYDVFLSFRGEDTRHGFTGNLYKALSDKGIHTFIDDEKLQRGEEITPALMKAIEESSIAITVLSEDYASSSFCLEELATILHCAQNRGLLVIPVFYKIDPSDVRHLKGTYEKAFAKHEEKFKDKKESFNHNMDKLKKWKKALGQVANLSGFHFKHGVGYEYKFIEKIVEQVTREINPACCLHVADYPVGLESQVLEVRKLLDVGSHDGVQMIGIHGMGGVGKSTLARAVYNHLIIAENFDGLCFLENVREKSNNQGLEHLQSFLLSKVLKEDINLTSWRQGAPMIHKRLQQKKVLLVLDDVDKHEQLQAIVGRRDWFGCGSRIIITTRDKQLLKSHQVSETYKVKKLNKNDALQLLTWKAFKKQKADLGYEEFLNCVVTYASGLPLALEVIGSTLFGKSIEKWKFVIEKYQRIPETDILKILKVSFDALGEEEKDVFLDIACCFKGCKLTEVEDILGAHYDHSIKPHIDVLVEKSLMKLHWGCRVTLHDLIEDMGKEIVRLESPKKPLKRSRLCVPEDIIKVLEDGRGSSKIEIIYLDFPISDKEERVKWDGNAFKKMKNLKTLIIKNGKFSEGPKCFPNSLRVLEWWGYPSPCLPSGFQWEKLVICKLPNSCISSFEFGGSSKKFENLTVLNFDKCNSLTEIPDVSGFPNLENLSFEKCDNLVEVHESIGFLCKLKKLSAFSCPNLKTFPDIQLTSLQELQLSNCSSLESFPEILGPMENLRKLHLRRTPIKELPSSIHYLVRLQSLHVEYCGTVHFPSSIFMIPELTDFDAYRMKGWKWLKQEEDKKTVSSIVPSKVNSLRVPLCNLNDDFFSIDFTQFAHLTYLDLMGNNFTRLPDCIKEFHSLWCLDVRYCEHLQEITGIPPNLTHFRATNCKSLTSSSTSKFINQEPHAARIREFILPGAWIPEWFDHQNSGPSSSFWLRNMLPVKVLCLLIAPVEVSYGPAPKVFINGKLQKSNFHADILADMNEVSMLEFDHTYLFELHLYRLDFKKEWNHVEVTYEGVFESLRTTYGDVVETSHIKATGIHVFKHEGNKEDIRFDDPYSNTQE